MQKLSLYCFLDFLFHFHLELWYTSSVIVYPGHQQCIVTSASGQTVMVTTFPSGSISHYVSSTGNYPNQAVVSQTGGGAQVVSLAPYCLNQVISTQASAAAKWQGAASVTYSNQGPPPEY